MATFVARVRRWIEQDIHVEAASADHVLNAIEESGELTVELMEGAWELDPDWELVNVRAPSWTEQLEYANYREGLPGVLTIAKKLAQLADQQTEA